MGKRSFVRSELEEIMGQVSLKGKHLLGLQMSPGRNQIDLNVAKKQAHRTFR